MTLCHASSKNTALNFMKNHCFDCHNDKKQKGDIRLDNYFTLSASGKEEMLNHVQKQVYLEQMSPDDEEQPHEKNYLAKTRKDIVDKLKIKVDNWYEKVKRRGEDK